jgi:hypothetical protein
MARRREKKAQTKGEESVKEIQIEKIACARTQVPSCCGNCGG